MWTGKVVEREPVYEFPGSKTLMGAKNMERKQSVVYCVLSTVCWLTHSKFFKNYILHSVLFCTRFRCTAQ